MTFRTIVPSLAIHTPERVPSSALCMLHVSTRPSKTMHEIIIIYIFLLLFDRHWGGGVGGNSTFHPVWLVLAADGISLTVRPRNGRVRALLPPPSILVPPTTSSILDRHHLFISVLDTVFFVCVLRS